MPRRNFENSSAGMEQSPENFEKIQKDIAQGGRNDRFFELSLQHEKNPLKRLGLLLDRDFSHTQAEAEDRLKTYMDEGRAGAGDLNRQYDRFKQEVVQAKQDFEEYTSTHAEVVNENTPGYKQLQVRVVTAVNNLETFSTEKLGMSPKEEQSEAA